MDASSYKRLAVMLSISFFIMYGVMFLNVARFEHVTLSVTRTYMSLLMVLPMASTMLLLMPKMFGNKKINGGIHLTVVVAFILILTLLRTQTPISDEQYMRAMIPHHSSAILTSEQANIQDPEVAELAKEIIRTQEEEIAEMQKHIARLENGD
jgi:hypothetical protein